MGKMKIFFLKVQSERNCSAETLGSILSDNKYIALKRQALNNTAMLWKVFFPIFLVKLD